MGYSDMLNIHFHTVVQEKGEKLGEFLAHY